MSQAGPLTVQAAPPVGEITFVTDVNSPAITVADVVNVVGGSTSFGTAAGIETDGSSGGNTLTIQLTNRVVGSVTTNNAVPTTLATLGMPAGAAVLNFDINLVAFDTTDGAGAGWKVLGTVRTTGVAATIVGVDTSINSKEAAMTTADATLIASGNNAIFQVTGVAGKTIDWKAVGYYVSVS